MNNSSPATAQSKSLINAGYAALGPQIAGEELQQLRQEAARLLESQERLPDARTRDYAGQFRVPVFYNQDWSVLINPLGLSDTFDSLFCKLITAPAVRSAIEDVLGKGYKLQGASLRRSESTDSGLKLHLDAPGQLEFMVLIEDALGASGTTAFVPGSHKYPVTARGGAMDFIHPKFLRPFLKTASGAAGDGFLFFTGRTWHGRLPSTDQCAHTGLFISFYAAGYEYKPWDIPPALLARLPEPVRTLYDPAIGTEPVANGMLGILPANDVPPVIDRLNAIPSWYPHPAQLLRPLYWGLSALRQLLLFKRQLFKPRGT